MHLVNEHGAVIGEFILGDIDPEPSKATQDKINTDTQDALTKALHPYLVKMANSGSTPSRGSVIDSVDSAWSDANITPMLFNLFLPELIEQIHRKLLPLAENIAQSVMADPELSESFSNYATMTRSVMADAIHAQITKNGIA